VCVCILAWYSLRSMHDLLVFIPGSLYRLLCGQALCLIRGIRGRLGMMVPMISLGMGVALCVFQCGPSRVRDELPT